MRLSKEKGFSLIELVVVVAVLSVLSAIAIPAFNCFRRRAISTAAQVSIQQIKTECESNFQDGINTFLPRTLNSYSIYPGDNYECQGETIALIPDSNLYPFYFYSFENGEVSFKFRGQSGTSLNECNKLICDVLGIKKINLNQDFVIPKTYVERNCSAYILVNGPSWMKAEENANKLNGHLVTVNDVEENEFIESIANNEQLGFLWIGLRVNEDSGTWEWSSGEESSDSNFDNFSRSIGQGDAGGDENYGAIVTRFNPHYEKWNYTSGGWHDSSNMNSIVNDAKGIVEIPICD